MTVFKEKIFIRPHVSQFIKWYIKSEDIRLSDFNIISSFLSLLLTTEEVEKRDNTPLPPQYSEPLSIIIDLPALIENKRFYLTNFNAKVFDTFAHSAFLKCCEVQTEAYQRDGLTRKAGRIAFLKRLEITPDMIDEDSVRRLIHFTRAPVAVRERAKARVGNNHAVKNIIKADKIISATRQQPCVLSLFAD